jgi:predicted DNA-binding transcriptional regulator AlpA
LGWPGAAPYGPQGADVDFPAFEKTLDTTEPIWDTRNRMNKLSTRAAAKELGLSSTSLDRYVSAGKVPAPKTQRIGGLKVRIWSDRDIEKVRKILPKIANGRKTRYQTERAKKKGSKKISKKK